MPKETTEQNKGEKKKQQFNIYLDEDIIRIVNIMSSAQRTTKGAFVEEAIKEYLIKRLGEEDLAKLRDARGPQAIPTVFSILSELQLSQGVPASETLIAQLNAKQE